MKMRVDKELVDRIGTVMRIRFTEDDLKMYEEDTTETLNMLEELDKLDTEGVEPTFYGGPKREAIFRKDEPVRNEEEVEALLDNAPMTKDTFIQVPAILDDGEGGA